MPWTSWRRWRARARRRWRGRWPRSMGARATGWVGRRRPGARRAAQRHSSGMAREPGRAGRADRVRQFEVGVGDRVIARRNDRGYDVDNGTRGTVCAVDRDTLGGTIQTDDGALRELPADYVGE